MNIVRSKTGEITLRLNRGSEPKTVFSFSSITLQGNKDLNYYIRALHTRIK